MDYQNKKDIEALIDGELEPEQAKRVLETIQHYPALKDYYQKLLKQQQILQQWWQADKKNRN